MVASLSISEKFLSLVFVKGFCCWFLSQKRKTLCLRDFILRSMERPWVLLKNGTRIFKIAIRLRDFHTKLICQNPMLRQIEWGLKKSRCIAMNGSFASNYLFFWKFCFSSRTSYNELIWWINHLNVYIRNFGKHWSFIRWVLFPVIIFVVLVRKKNLHSG